MRIQENVNLKKYNTFGLNCIAERLFHLENEVDLVKYHQHQNGYAKQRLLFSGGSNLLLCSEIKGTVAKIEWNGIKIIKETEQDVLVEVAAGHSWHAFVLWAIDSGFGGIENLSLIPGHVGTAPIQNIGAYGVEIKDSIESLRYYRWETGEIEILSNKICDFGYRTSIFKTQWRDKGVILSVNFKLTKDKHNLNTQYGSVIDEINKMGELPSILSISKAIISIRNNKLPDPKVIGNSGSFFKNPIISKNTLNELKEKHKDIPFYDQENGKIKLSAGWLIEMCGWKGKTHKDAGMHDKQALVLVNHGNATGEELWAFANHVKEDVYKNYKIKLEPEVNLIGLFNS